MPAQPAARPTPITPDPQAELVLLTPELAQEWLGRNTHNRPLKTRKIEQYARDIEAGRWLLTGESIKFATDGRLLDGQNRLHAVIKADKPIKVLVVRGLRPDAQNVMDTGVARTVGDALAMSGVSNAMRVAASARIAMAVEQKVPLGTSRFSNSEVQAWVMDHIDICEAHTILGTDSRLVPLPPAVRVYCAWRLMQVDEPAASEFFSQLATGVGTSQGSPILALRRRLAGTYGAERRITQTEQVTSVFRAWNAWRQGRPLERVLGTDRFGAGIPEPV